MGKVNNHSTILNLLKDKGYDNVKFLDIFNKSGNSEDKVYVECTIREFEDEEHLYAFPNNYKMYVDAIDERYGSTRYYVSDFISLLDDGCIKLLD